MSVGLEARHWRIYVTTLNFKFRQHLIYLVLSIIVGLLFKEGTFLVILIAFVYFKRFPKTYWFYFLLSLGAVFYVNLAFKLVQFENEIPIYIKEAKVIEIKKKSEEKQTAKIKSEAGQFYLTLTTNEPNLIPGDWITVNAEVELITDPTIPHAFNFKQYLQCNGMKGSVYLTSTEVIRHEWSVRQYQYQFSNWIKVHFPPLTATYLQSWFLGVKNDLTEEVNDSYSTLGIIHLFAVSGLHVGLLLGMIGFIFKRLGVIQELASFLLIGLLLVFMIVSGATPSIVRAGCMAILACLNRQFKWKLSSLDIFSFVFLFNFIIFPLQVYQIGFIYSYWLTFSLILCQSFIKLLSPKVTILVIPLLAQLAVLPIQLSQSYSINLLSYFSNLVLIPAVTTLLIPLLLVTLIIPPLAIISEHVLYLFEQVILLAGQYLNLPWIIGTLSITCIVLIVCLLLLVGWSFEKNSHLKRWFVILVGIFIFLESVRGFKPSSKVTFLDVGQGDSTVIQSPYQKCTIVVDTGGKVSFTGETTSIFEQTLKPYLLGEGVRTVDYLILSQGDFDHIGEAKALMQTFNVKQLVVPSYSDSEVLRELILLARKLDIKVFTPKNNQVLTCGNQTLTFLQPNTKQDSENDQSLVMTLQMDGVSVLLTGDMSTQIEPAILSNYELSQLDIYKAAHHGSNTSNSLSFLETLSPTISVVSAGKNNRYGHPSQEFLTVLSDLNIPLLNTQVDGSIQFEVKNGKVLIHRFR